MVCCEIIKLFIIFIKHHYSFLQDHGAQTIQFVTNGKTSSFAINDLLAQGSGSEVFYLTHREAEEPTLLLMEADDSELVKD